MPKCPHCDEFLEVRVDAREGNVEVELIGKGVISADAGPPTDATIARRNASKAADPVPATPAKVFRFEVGDVVTRNGASVWLYRSGNVYSLICEISWMVKQENCSTQPNLIYEELLSRPEIESHLATLGYRAEWPDATNCAGKTTPAKVEAGAAKVETRQVFEFLAGDVVTIYCGTNHYIYRNGRCGGFSNSSDFENPRWDDTPRAHSEVEISITDAVAHLNKHGWDAKFPEATPASDSAKGERDRHGREIVKREGHAMVVNCGSNYPPFVVVDTNADFWFYCGEKWIKEDKPDNAGNYDKVSDADADLTKAAATPLPTPSPAAVEAKPYAFNGPIPSGPSAAELSDLRLRVSDLEKANQSLTADLERYRDRLAKVEGSLNKGNA